MNQPIISPIAWVSFMSIKDFAIKLNWTISSELSKYCSNIV
jgi:hypothetical protein